MLQIRDQERTKKKEACLYRAGGQRLAIIVSIAIQRGSGRELPRRKTALLQLPFVGVPNQKARRLDTYWTR